MAGLACFEEHPAVLVSCNLGLPHACPDLFQSCDKMGYTQLSTSGRKLLSTQNIPRVKQVPDGQQSSQMAHLP